MKNVTANGKGPGATNAQPLEVTTNTAIVNQPAVDRKRGDSLVARAALAGLPVYRLAGGGFLAVWGVARILPDEAAVEALLARLGATK
jgi:hypothetical protein